MRKPLKKVRRKVICKPARKPTRMGALGEFVVTDEQTKNAMGNKAVGAIRMTPDQFLRLTTESDEHRREIAAEAKLLDDYNGYTRSGGILNPPFLTIDMTTGKVCGHEGRHRAAALAKAEPGTPLPVNVILKRADCSYAKYYEEKWENHKPNKRYMGVDDAPDKLCNEYGNGYCVRVDKSTWRGFYDKTKW